MTAPKKKNVWGGGFGKNVDAMSILMYDSINQQRIEEGARGLWGIC